jgi:hypothetical protein
VANITRASLFPRPCYATKARDDVANFNPIPCVSSGAAAHCVYYKSAGQSVRRVATSSNYATNTP